MTPDLRSVEDQVIVITGATSGIGLTTARMAARRGARLVLVARSEDALDDLTHEISEAGGEAVYVATDVSDPEAAGQIVAVAEETYGGFDTWVNGAAQFIYGRLDEVPVNDMREQFETNVWGLLYGSLAAAAHYKNRHKPGAIINVGSVASDQALPMQGSYSASKHAVKAFTDALRAELMAEDAPVSVTLIKPASIDTPYPEHAKNYMDEAPDLPPPVYAPETVARAILNAAESPQRDVYVGGGAKWLSAMGTYASGLTDRLMSTTFISQQKQDEPARTSEENILDEPVGDLEQRGDHEGHVSDSSLYTRLTQRGPLSGPVIAGLGLAAGVALAAGYRALRSREEPIVRVRGHVEEVEEPDEEEKEPTSIPIEEIGSTAAAAKSAKDAIDRFRQQ
ncbi:SDR family oxidoreductase [Halomicrobium salinisoli]|uniref:SDR family oxidoreductase n=1 Tax=Halomicrobium salinisoli TaxID=2878391 RepID=UPI001CEFF53D|nr:SDR family oxidoreductase [Halomicrobium salinisoli]